MINTFCVIYNIYNIYNDQIQLFPKNDASLSEFLNQKLKRYFQNKDLVLNRIF